MRLKTLEYNNAKICCISHILRAVERDLSKTLKTSTTFCMLVYSFIASHFKGNILLAIVCSFVSKKGPRHACVSVETSSTLTERRERPIQIPCARDPPTTALLFSLRKYVSRTTSPHGLTAKMKKVTFGINQLQTRLPGHRPIGWQNW